MTPTKELYGQIEEAYRFFNERLFASSLPHCIITLQRKPNAMGYVSHSRWISTDANAKKLHELAVNPEYWLGWPLAEALATLVHEQCHIWQSAFSARMKQSKSSYHNQEWAEKMISVGLMPSSTGFPGGSQTGYTMNDYIMLDGPFHNALSSLLTSGFWISWLDRFPKPCESPVKIFDSDGRRYELDGTLALTDKPDVRHHLMAGDSKELVLSDHTSISFLPEAAKFSKPTRVKYSCADCGNNLWGKPQLNVICGDCNIAFEATIISEEKKP